MVVRNREARIRQTLTSAPRSGRNGAKRRGELWSCRQGRARRIVRSIRLRIATKELPENAAFETQVHRLRSQSAGPCPATTAGIPGRAFRCSAHDIGLQRLPMTTSGVSRPAMAARPLWLGRGARGEGRPGLPSFRSSPARCRLGSAGGGVSPHHAQSLAKARGMRRSGFLDHCQHHFPRQAANLVA